MIAFIGLGGTELLLVLLSVVFPIVALIDILRSDFRQSNDKLIWVLVVLFLNILGAILYAVIGRNQRVG